MTQVQQSPTLARERPKRTAWCGVRTACSSLIAASFAVSACQSSAKVSWRDNQAFLAVAMSKLVANGQFGAATRYLQGTDYLGSRTYTAICRTYQSVLDDVDKSAQQATFVHDYDSLRPIVPGDLSECTTYVRDSPRTSYETARPSLPRFGANVTAIRDVLRICTNISPYMDRCSYLLTCWAARWSLENNGVGQSLYDEHRDDLIAEAVQHFRCESNGQ